jgi:class 3 adenylate cyclase
MLHHVVVCPHCGGENPPGFAFCGHCGRPLPGESPSAVAEERKVVTVLFCDLVGFTAHSEHADPEDVRARVAPYFARLRAAVQAYGGTLEKYIGDAIEAVFGSPHEHEDDPERAVRAGLRILREMEDLNAADPSLELRVRVGIHTGEVLARLTPSHDQSEGMITGSAVSMASRLQSAAPENGIAVSEATYAATREVFDYRELDPATLKGITGPVALWQPIASRTPLGIDITRTHTLPLVDRSEELELLERTFARAVRDASVQTVTIAGEPGIGKSRLLLELNRYLDSLHDLVRWRQGRCLPYGDGITFWALGQILKAEARIYDSDDPETTTSKLAGIVPAGPDAEWYLQRLRPLVGLSAPEASIDENFAAWRRLLEHLAEDMPSVFILEDLHWADDAMLGFIEYLAEYAAGIPMLIIGTARPELFERRREWLGRVRNAAIIDLSPLTETETNVLAESLLDQRDLPASVRSLITSRSGGNPLYAEEFVGLLTERGILHQDDGTWRLAQTERLPLPTGIRSLIAARLDTLDARRKAMLADAAVIGETFWAGAVAEMGGLEAATVAADLHGLSRKELVRRSRTSSIKGDTEYHFWHALLRDVAYGQIPRLTKADKHLAAAGWLESAAPERLEEFSEILASHYGEALSLFRSLHDPRAEEVEAPALRFLELAGERAMGLDVVRAEAHFTRAFQLTRPGTEPRARVLDRLAQLAQLARADLADSARLYGEAIQAWEELGREDRAAELQLRLAVVADNQGERARSLALIDGVIGRLERYGPTPALARAYAERAYPAWGPSLGEAIGWADRALALADQLELPDVRATAMGFRGASRVNMGDVKGLDDQREALRRSLDLGIASKTYTTFANLVMGLGYEAPGAALALADEGLAFARSRGLIEGETMIGAVRLEVLFHAGRWQDLLADSETLLESVEAQGDRWGRLTASFPRAWVLSLTGRIDETESLIKDLVEDAAQMDLGADFAGSWIRVLRARDRTDEAGRVLEEVITNAERERLPLRETLGDLAREAIAIGRHDLLERCHGLCAGDLAIIRNGRQTLTALRAEAAGQDADAATAFAAAADAWSGFGNAFESAHAMFGRGRCLLRSGDPNGRTSMHEARSVFEALDAAPAVADVDARLAQLT